MYFTMDKRNIQSSVMFCETHGCVIMPITMITEKGLKDSTKCPCLVAEWL